MHYNASMCSYYIIHDAYVQAYYMMCLDVHTSRHLDVHDVYYMMMRHRSRRDENLVENLVDNT